MLTLLVLFSKVPKERPPVTFVKAVEPVEETKPAFEVLTRLVTYTLQHDTEIEHAFQKCR